MSTSLKHKLLTVYRIIYRIIDLYANGIRTVHVYTMNNPDVAAKILDNLSEIFEPRA